MANRLITVEEASGQLLEVILNAADEMRAEGMSDEQIAKGFETFFAALGGFPAPTIPPSPSRRSS